MSSLRLRQARMLRWKNSSFFKRDCMGWSRAFCWLCLIENAALRREFPMTWAQLSCPRPSRDGSSALDRGPFDGNAGAASEPYKTHLQHGPQIPCESNNGSGAASASFVRPSANGIDVRLTGATTSMMRIRSKSLLPREYHELLHEPNKLLGSAIREGLGGPATSSRRGICTPDGAQRCRLSGGGDRSQVGVERPS